MARLEHPVKFKITFLFGICSTLQGSTDPCQSAIYNMQLVPL